MSTSIPLACLTDLRKYHSWQTSMCHLKEETLKYMANAGARKGKFSICSNFGCLRPNQCPVCSLSVYHSVSLSVYHGVSLSVYHCLCITVCVSRCITVCVSQWSEQTARPAGGSTNQCIMSYFSTRLRTGEMVDASPVGYRQYW